MTKSRAKTYMTDTHVHFFAPAAVEWLERVPSLTEKFATETVQGFLKNHPSYDRGAFLAIARELESSGLPALPHWIDPIYCAMRADVGDINSFVVLPIDMQTSGNMSESLIVTNSQVMSLVLRFPETIIGAISVNPGRKDAVLLLERELRALDKLSGIFRPVVKIHPLFQRFDPATISDAFYKIIESFGAVLVTHTGVLQAGPTKTKAGKPDRFDILVTDPARLIPIIERHPDLRVILAHTGTPDFAVNAFWRGLGVEIKHFENAVDMILQYPTVFGEISGLMLRGHRGFCEYDDTPMKDFNFGNRSVPAFHRLSEMFRTRMRTTYDSKVLFRDKFVLGTDHPLTKQASQVKLQTFALGYNPLRNSAKVLMR